MFLFQLGLNFLFGRATHVRIVKGEMIRGKAEEQDFVYEAGSAELSSLRQALEVRPDVPFRCLCNGNYAIEFYRNDQNLTTIGYHHHQRLRHPLCPLDISLKDSEGLARWLQERGVSELLDDIARRREVLGN